MSEQPMTRRERREWERREAERRAAEAAGRDTSSASTNEEAPTRVPEAPVVEPAQPMTRRQLRELERQRAEAEAARALNDTEHESTASDAQPEGASPAPESVARDAAASASDASPESVHDDGSSKPLSATPELASSPAPVSTSASAREHTEDTTAPLKEQLHTPHEDEGEPPTPLFPEVRAPRSRDEGPVLLWNPSATVDDAPRRARASFGLPDDSKLPVVRDTRQAPEPGSPAEDIDDYFSRLITVAQQDEPPTGSITMPPVLNVDETDAHSRAALQRRDENSDEPGWRDTLNPADIDPEDDPEALEADGIDDTGVLDELFGPRPARSAVSAHTETGFTAPDDLDEPIEHLSRSQGQGTVGTGAGDETASDELGEHSEEQDAATPLHMPTEVLLSIGTTAPHADAEEGSSSLHAAPDSEAAPTSTWKRVSRDLDRDEDDESIPTSWKIAAVGVGAGAVGVVILVWNLIQGWFS